jgi:hypothetical protein
MATENTRKWVDNIKTNIEETGCIDLEWVLTGTSKHGIKHSGSVEVGQLLGYVTLKFSKRILLHCLLVVHCNGAS